MTMANLQEVHWTQCGVVLVAGRNDLNSGGQNEYGSNCFKLLHLTSVDDQELHHSTEMIQIHFTRDKT